ncbi:hypothetical protein C8J55DRAFT_566130 [Lentinula edodes]|uniref:Uncharacterized protein n=1 Tax=Lentinula lateritia TaxID=40482 RepID=A0A9W9DE54_9AGAR|nr:hypothetical protein C8J55DRAFT_566130 [Lentinula edodes]
MGGDCWSKQEIAYSERSLRVLQLSYMWGQLNLEPKDYTTKARARSTENPKILRSGYQTLSEKFHTVFSIYAGINYGEQDRQFYLVTLVFHNTAACLNNCFRLSDKVFLAVCHATPLDLILDYLFIYEEDIALLMHPSRWRSISFATYNNRVGKEVFGALKDGPELSHLKVASPRHLILQPEKAESVMPFGRNLQ